MFISEWPEPPEWLYDVVPYQPKSTFQEEVSALLKLKATSPAGIREWILDLCRVLDTSPSWLSRKAGLAPSTLNRFLQGNDESASLNAKTIEKVGDAAFTILKDALEAPNLNEKLFFRVHNESYRKKRAENPQQHASHVLAYNSHLHGFPEGPTCHWPMMARPTTAALSKCRLCNGLFETRADWSLRYEHELSLPLVGVEVWQAVRAFVLEGAAGLPTYKHGGILIGTLLAADPLPLEPDSEVIAYRRNDDGRVACELWRYQNDPAGRAWLMPLDPNSQAAGIFVGAHLNANPMIYVGHRVVGAMAWN